MHCREWSSTREGQRVAMLPHGGEGSGSTQKATSLVGRVPRLPLDRLPQAVLFDNDGIVLNSEPLIFEATARVFAQYGIQITPEDVQYGIGAGAKYVMDPMTKYGLGSVTVEDLMKARETTFRELAAGRLQPFPDFLPFIHFLRCHGVRTALASSAATDVVRHNLALAGVPPELFDSIVDSSKIQRKKPAPDIFLAGAAELGVQPCDCLVIEDAPAGIAAARNAGMPVVALTTSLPGELLQEAGVVMSSLQDVHHGMADLPGVAPKE